MHFLFFISSFFVQEPLDSFYLDPKYAVHEIKLARNFLSRPPEAIQVSMDVDNKNKKSFMVQVFLLDSARRVLVGNMGAYPADANGKFIMRFDEPAKKLTAGFSADMIKNHEFRLRFVLSHTEPNSGIRLLISGIKWVGKVH